MRLATAVALWAALGLPAAHAATFAVTSTADSGPGSFRQAVLDANALAGADAIEFVVATTGIPRIALAAPLPTVTDPVTIDGTSQSAGWVELDGQATTAAAGLTLDAGGSTVRGLVINGFDSAGIRVTGAGGNVIESTRIGTDTSGTQGKSPLAYGLDIFGSPANHVRGNVVSGNLFGVFVHGSAAVGNVIEGNFIGTDPTGMAAVPNAATGIWIFGAKETIIGGDNETAGNVVSGNAADGIDVGGLGAIDTVIVRNAIGYAADYTTPVGNGADGVYVYGGAGRSSIVGNLIGNNGGAGVKVDSTGGTRNAVRSNAITDNGGLGIDLGAVGVAGNDAGDTDGGPNAQQNFPVLDVAFVGGTDIAGTLDSVPNSSFMVEVFAINNCDASGHGEGAEILGVTPVTTDGAGHAEFTVPLSRTVDASQEHVTATASDALANTSEFSACAPATLLPTTSTSTTSTSTTTTELSTTSTTVSTSTTTTAAGSTSTTTLTSTTTTVAASTSTTTSTVSTSTSTTEAGGTTTTTLAGATTTTAPATTSTTTAVSSTTTTTNAGGTSTTTLQWATTTTAAASTSTTSTLSPSSTTTSAVSTSTTTTEAGGTTTTTLPGVTTTTGPESTSTTSTASTSTTTTDVGGTSTTTLPEPTTTTAPASTSTTSTAPSSTTTTDAGATSTTTSSTTAVPTTTSTTLAECLPAGACSCMTPATFDSVRCRLVTLNESVPRMGADVPTSRMVRHLARAERLLDLAQQRCTQARVGPAKRKLTTLGRRVGRLIRVVRRCDGAALPAAVESFVGTATLLLDDARALAHGLVCR